MNDQQLEIILKQIDLVEAATRQMEDIRQNIKNWCIVTWAALLGLSITEQSASSVVGATMLIPLIFWFLEGLYRRQQSAFVERRGKIKEYLNDYFGIEHSSTAADFRLLEVGGIYGKRWSRLDNWFLLSVCSLYLLLSVISAAASIAVDSGWLTAGPQSATSG